MASDDSDDEPLSALLEVKKLNPAAFASVIIGKEGPTKKKRKRCKKLPVTIDLVPSLKNFITPPVIQRPDDVWLYLKDFNPAGPYSCLICPEWFINRSKMIVHYILNHKKDFCGICRYFVPDREAFLNHVKFHSPWSCSQCSDTFETEPDLRQHFRESHNLVYCRLCQFLVPNNDQHLKHLLEKHSVTNTASRDEEFFWELDPDGSPKFDCLLCSKTDILTTNYFNHFFCFHHFTLKNFSNMIAGKEIPFTIAGVKISLNFIETQLKDQKKCGYVDLDWKPEANESINADENSVPLEALIPEVKQEPTSDNEDPFAECKDEIEDTSGLPDSLKSYKGEVDFDITQTELIILQKCIHDYIAGTIDQLNCDKVPESSEIDYKHSNADFDSLTCTICSNKYESVDKFSSHMNRMHGVKIRLLYSCRVCLASFDNLDNLTAHSMEELGEFQDLWICQFCDKEFDDRELTRRHLTEHLSSMDVDNCFSPHLGFKCRYCPTLFWNEPDRENHLVKVHFADHKEEFFKCESCSELFSDKVWFVHHYLSSHPPAPSPGPGPGPLPRYLYKCALCAGTLRDELAARAHFDEQHAHARKIFCEISPCKFRPLAHRGTFMIHLKAAHGRSKAAACNVCGRVFPSARARGAHSAAAHARAGFRCKLCGDALCTSDERKLHYLLKHPGRHPYQCGLCPRSFSYKSTLYAHRAVHNGPSASFTCSYCGKTFLKKDSYREHLQIHAGPRHACSYCPQRFVQRSNMLRHERRHTGERPYACQLCPREFSDRGAATSHARTHSKDRSFKCLYCGQAFAQKSKLTYHTRKHTGENLETCPECGKLFTSACSLREHAKTHSAARGSVACPLCDRKYHDERAMVRHVRASHGAGSAQRACPLCDRTFTDSTALRHHVPTHCERNMFQCKYCSKSYAVKRSMVSHLQRRHQLKPDELGDDHYVLLDVRDCGLKLDEETIAKIFGPRRAETEVTLTDHVTVTAQPPPAQEPAEMAQVTVKMESQSDGELEPTDFVSVKIEPLEEDL